MKLAQFDFRFSGPFGQEIAAALAPLARSIAEEPGLIWKIWTENPATQEAGGIYLFADEASAKAYVAKHAARLQQFGITNVNAKLFDVNAPLSAITNAPLPATLTR